MTNPFEDEEYDYRVLLNKEGQHSLWPAFREVPAGSTLIGQRANARSASNGFETNWTDMRPKSLVDAMNKHRPS